jgi:hypothetical protein
MRTVIWRGVSGTRRSEFDPRGRLRGVVPWPGHADQRGVQLVDVNTGHCHASDPQQLGGDRLGGLGVGVILPAPEQAVSFRPSQPHRECPAAGVIGEHHEECGNPEPATTHPLARPWLGVRDPYRRDSKTTRAWTKCRIAVVAGDGYVSSPAAGLFSVRLLALVLESRPGQRRCTIWIGLPSGSATQAERSAPRKS